MSAYYVLNIYTGHQICGTICQVPVTCQSSTTKDHPHQQFSSSFRSPNRGFERRYHAHLCALNFHLVTCPKNFYLIYVSSTPHSTAVVPRGTKFAEPVATQRNMASLIKTVRPLVRVASFRPERSFHLASRPTRWYVILKSTFGP